LAAKKYKPQPIVVRELSTLSVATRIGSLYMFAEDYAKHSKFDFSKANLRAVQLTLQNISHDTYVGANIPAGLAFVVKGKFRQLYLGGIIGWLMDNGFALGCGLNDTLFAILYVGDVSQVEIRIGISGG